ncbi:hypothetical protein F8S13_14670 [Chloroflexia bacterium SDU3-3]|nr:hypothetical protein F8S13_14670 [Chloroflexia bacterium SDU3-3]
MKLLTAYPAIAMAALVVVLTSACAATPSAAGSPASATPGEPSASPAPDPSALPFETFRETTFSSFVKNTYPDFLLAAIRSEQEWDAIFHPAPVMGKQQAFAPETSLYKDRMILLIRRVAPAVANDSTFTVESVSRDGDRLTVRYQYTEPSPAASAQYSASVGIIIPSADYADATFIENGKDVGKLDIKGQVLK